jgi:hypothetical protein
MHEFKNHGFFKWENKRKIKILKLIFQLEDEKDGLVQDKIHDIMSA